MRFRYIIPPTAINHDVGQVVAVGRASQSVNHRRASPIATRDIIGASRLWTATGADRQTAAIRQRFHRPDAQGSLQTEIARDAAGSLSGNQAAIRHQPPTGSETAAAAARLVG